MGININTARFLLTARDAGVAFERTATIGRQIMYVAVPDVRNLLRAFGMLVSADEAQAMIKVEGQFCEPFLRKLGASVVDSIDASSYEGATIAHDMNEPIAPALHGRYTVVYDGGSLEHVFNFPVAIRNCMEMIAEGGHYIGVTPTNNLAGHGFYQFSPELYYRVFSPENGFETLRMIVSEDRPPYDWYEVIDPRQAGRRVRLKNFCDTYLLVLARRTAVVAPFSKAPQQSDYVAAWNGSRPPGGGLLNTPKEATPRISRLLPRPLKRLLRPFYNATRDAALMIPSRRLPPEHFRRVPPR